MQHGTEVSLEYEVTFDLTDINKDKNIILSKYSLDGGTTFFDMPAGNVVNGEINLPNSRIALSDADKALIRVYWEWYEDITNPTLDSSNTKIGVTTLVKQKV